jgi:hypothetical protein
MIILNLLSHFLFGLSNIQFSGGFPTNVSIFPHLPTYLESITLLDCIILEVLDAL